MIFRWTLWTYDDSNDLQMSVALLDEAWEPLVEFTKPCGPFHEASETRMVLMDDVRRWLRQTGYQAELPLP
jgi:hypothetical protein